MDYHTARLTITANDLAAWLRAVVRRIRQRRRPPASPSDPAQRLAAAARHEIASAHHLLKHNHLRAAGAVAGVALELHLKAIARAHHLDERPYATIAQVQNTLRYAGVLTRPQCRMINKFAAIRNQCVHARPEPVRRAAVETLVRGVAQLMQLEQQEQHHG